MKGGGKCEEPEKPPTSDAPALTETGDFDYRNQAKKAAEVKPSDPFGLGDVVGGKDADLRFAPPVSTFVCGRGSCIKELMKDLTN